MTAVDLTKLFCGVDVRKTVDALEIKLASMEQENCPVYHHFSPGIYIREVNVPADTVAIGHRQKTRHLNIFLKGRVSIVNDDGSVSELKAPMIFTGEPGRKFGYVHEDMVWLNVYPTDETDVEKLEDMFLDKSDGWKSSQAKIVERIADREDFKSAIAEYGFDEETVHKQSFDESDMTEFPSGTYNVAVFDSAIHGKGLFASANISVGDVIAPARIDGKRTPAGRFVNHAIAPNARMERFGSDVYLVATRDISGNRAGINGEEITTDYREALDTLGVKKCQD